MATLLTVYITILGICQGKSGWPARRLIERCTRRPRAPFMPSLPASADRPGCGLRLFVRCAVDQIRGWGREGIATRWVIRRPRGFCSSALMPEYPLKRVATAPGLCRGFFIPDSLPAAARNRSESGNSRPRSHPARSYCNLTTANPPGVSPALFVPDSGAGIPAAP